MPGTVSVVGAEGTSRWRRVAGWRVGRTLTVGMSLTLLLVACGGTTDAADDERPCSEMLADLEEAGRVRAESFGGGPEGQEAMETIAAAIEARPDCFDEPRIVSGEELLGSLPEDIDDAIADAEEACSGEATRVSHHDAPGRFDPADREAAMAESALPPPEGTATPSLAGDRWAAYDFHDDQGVFGGRVLVDDSDHGSSVWVVTCAAPGR